MAIPIKGAKIWDTGDSYVITVPRQLVTNGIVNREKSYDVALTEVKA